MKRITLFALLIALIVPSVAVTQSTGVSGASGKTLASTMNIYVFPSQGQNSEQQSKDEGECYNWAVQNTGTDPFELSKSAQQQAQQAEAAQQQAKQAGKGAGARGAVGGAAAGALIGEIVSDDPGKGAAYGAAAGLMAGRRSRKKQQKSAQSQANQQAAQVEQTTAEQMGNFKKAFSVCLEAKEYMVKY
jgi:hypothetical protein